MRWLSRFVELAVWVLYAVVALSLAGLAWAVFGTSLPRWAIGQLVESSAGAIEAGQVEGSIATGLKIDRLLWRDPATRVELDKIELRLSWVSLLAAELRLRELRVDRIAIALSGQGSATGSASLPQQWGVPVALSVDELAVGELRIEAPGLALPVLEAISATLEVDETGLRVPRLSVAAPSLGVFDASAEVAARAPFPTRLRIRMQPSVAGWPGLSTLLLDAAGPIDALDTQLRLLPPPGRTSLGEPGVEPAWAVLRATVRPFESAPVRSARLAVEGLEPAAIGLAVPSVRLSGSIEAQLAPTGGGGGTDHWSGRIDLRNAQPGPIDAGLLPVRSLLSDFAWSGSQLAFESIRVDDGAVSGRVAIDTAKTRRLFDQQLPQVEARLAVRDLDLSTFHREAWPTRLTGSIDLAGQDLRAMLAEASHGGLSLAVDARIDEARVRLSRLGLRTPSGSLSASGWITWRAPWRTDLSGRFESIEPARFAAIAGMELPQRLRGLEGLSGDWKLAGELAPSLGLDSRLRIESGRLEGRPLAIQWAGRVSARSGGSVSIPSLEVSALDLSVSLGADVLRASGSAGRPGDSLRIRARIPSLASLDSSARGRLTMDGEVSIPGFDSHSLARTQFELAATLDDAMRDALLVQSAQVRLAGRLDGHRLDLRGSVGQGQGRIALSGGLQSDGGSGASGWRWVGAVDTLEISKPVTALLKGSAPMVFDGGGVELGSAVLTVDDGRIDLQRLVWRGGKLETRGAAEGLPVSAWASRFGLVPAEAGPIGEIRLDAEWSLAGPTLDELDGRVGLRSRTSARLDGDGEADLALDRGRLSGEVDLKLPSLSVFNRRIGPEWALAGRVRVTGSLSGSLRAPRLEGSLQGRDIAFVQRRLGWRMSEGTLNARFAGDRLQVTSLRLKSGDGSISLTGTLALQDMLGEFRLLADRLPVPVGPGQRIVVSGDTTIATRAGALRWSGRIRADEGLIELSGGEAPSLPGDVVIIDAATAAAPAETDREPAGSAPASQVRLEADLQLDLGERLRVRGRGVDVRLAGLLSLRGALPDSPQANGTVRVRDGTYRAYGQTLEITRGSIVFNGPLDNPLLDIVAMRRGGAVEAGVAVTGTALSPRIRLVSEPEVPDSQKLSWLVLGAGLEDARTGGQVAALQAAAATLFGGEDSGLVGNLQRALGLDVLTVRSATGASGYDPSFGATFQGQIGSTASTTVGAAQDVVAIGKRLNSRLLVTYEQGLRGVWSLLRAQYDLTRSLSVRAQTGTDTAVDLLYFYSFD